MDEKATKQERVEEAKQRLATLTKHGLHPNVLSDFRHGVLNYSERIRLGKHPMGALYWLDNEERFAKAVHEFEKEFECTAYHVTHEHTNIGETLTVFYVTSERDEWELDRADMEDNHICAYVINLDDDNLSEFGGVGYAISGGGIIRTY